MTSFLLGWFKNGRFEITPIVRGALTGLVAISAGCDTFRPGYSLIVGLLAGLLYRVLSTFLAYKHVDDPVDAVSIHFVLIYLR